MATIILLRADNAINIRARSKSFNTKSVVVLCCESPHTYMYVPLPHPHTHYLPPTSSPNSYLLSTSFYSLLNGHLQRNRRTRLEIKDLGAF